ncbi:magnesium transporter [soil metagenome]
MNPTAELLIPEVEELLSAKTYAELREVLHDLPRADVADIISALEPDQAAMAFRILPYDDAGHVFAYLPVHEQEELIKQLGAHGVSLVESMDVDDRARLLEELPPEVAQRIIGLLSSEERRQTQAVLGYPAGSVGRLMTPDFVSVRADWTVAQALEHIRRNGRDAETINVVYVVGEAGKLVDDLRLRQIFLAEPGATIESLMNHQFVSLTADQPQRDAVDLLQKYDRIALPVLDSKGALLGIVTHDDVADVAEEEATSDMHKMGGVRALDEPYITTSLAALFKKRAPWLALLFLSELLTSNAIAYYEDDIQRAAILAAFIPAIISSGGNSGSQASTLVIRALSLKEISTRDWFRVLRRELTVALMLGGLIGVLGMIRICSFGWLGWFADPDVNRHYVVLGMTIALTLFFIVIWGSVMGAMLPLLMKKMRLDPAGSSTPFVATLVDVTGIVIYFTVATIVLRHSLLRPDMPDTHVITMVEAKILEVEYFKPGEDEVRLRIATRAQAQHDQYSRVVLSAKKIPAGSVPHVGERWSFKFSSQDAAAAHPLDAAPGDSLPGLPAPAPAVAPPSPLSPSASS